MIETLHLFEELGAGLVALLEGLTTEEWRKPTIHRDRDVKDLASHLLDTAQRRLAMQRDGWFAEGPSASDWDTLVAFIQRMNREWMDATRRLSPRQLVAQLARVEEELIELLRSKDPHGPAIFSVAWAGEAVSEHWFDVAREYTERWHHQQQIRDAVGRPGFDEARFRAPVLTTFLRGAPHAYRDVAAAAGTAVTIDAGEARVTLVRGEAGWTIGASDRADASIGLAAGDAWRLWTKGLAPDEARARARTNGPEALVAPIFRYVAIMA